ncbi:TPA: hypothetical protein HA244_00730 [Candidatus Micrarchaeota archaeon]|nr:hypothetical protein [Candidatus Micrarchaeota archaeon]
MVFDVIYSRLVFALSDASANFLLGLIDFLIVVLFLIMGWIVSMILVSVFEHFLGRIGLEKELKRRGIHDALFGFTLTDVLCKALKLLTLAAFLGIAAEVTNLTFLGQLVSWFVGYVPLFVQGLAILVLALLAGDYLTDTIKKSSMPFRNLVGWVIEAFIVYTAVVIALPLFLPNADVSILRTAFMLLLGAVGLAFGLGLAIAIGLGMKDTVARVAKKKEDDLEKLV